VRELATCDVYRPLSSELRAQLVTALRTIRNQYSDFDVKFSVTPERGNRVRDKVANELARLLADSGFEAKTTRPMITNLNGTVLIILNPDDTEFVNQLCKVVGRFINIRFQGLEDSNLLKGTLKIHIIGDPLFSPDGVVTFR